MPTLNRRILAAALAVAHALSLSTEGQTVVADDRGAGVDIVVGADATPTEQYAAAELAAFLRQSTGQTFRVVEPGAAGKPRLCVGVAAAKLADRTFSIDGLGADGIVLRSVGNDLIIAGGRPRGTLYAVYTLLEDYLGVRWWTPTVSDVPRHETLQLPSMAVRYTPQFCYRMTFTASSTMSDDWAARNKVHGRIHPPPSAKHGGGFEVNNFCHTFFFQIPPDTYFDQHPEWFSMIDGQRVRDKQLCLSNPALLAEMIRRARETLTARPEIQHLWVSQNDWGGPCTCPECTAIDEAEGAPSGSLIRFVNAVAADIATAWPEVLVCTLAYQYSMTAPKQTKPRDNVCIWFCDVGANFAQPLDHSSNEWIYTELARWAAIARRLYVWEYTVNFWHMMNPHPSWFTVGPNIKLMAKHGVSGAFLQGVGPTPDTDMGAMRAWVEARMLWDPSRDDRQLIREFLSGYYGPAGPHLLAYLERFAQEARERDFYASYKYNPDGRYSYGPPLSADARILSLPALLEGWQHLEAAAAAVERSDDLRPRVDLVRANMMYLFLARWDELRAAAVKAEKAWPVGEKDEVQAAYKAIVTPTP